MRYSRRTKLRSWRHMDEGRSLEHLRFCRSTRYSTDTRIAVARTCRSTDARRVLAPCDRDDRGRRSRARGEGRCIPYAAPDHPAAHSGSCLHAGTVSDDRSNSVGQAAASMTSAPNNQLRMVTRAKRLTLVTTMGAMYVLRHGIGPRAFLAVLSPGNRVRDCSLRRIRCLGRRAHQRHPP